MKQSATPLIAKLTQAGIPESVYTWYGLIVGMLCVGFEEGAHQLNRLCQTLLNDDEPLPGVLTAAITSVSLEASELLRHKDASLLQLPSARESSRTRLNALSELVNGLELGLSCDPKSGGMLSKINDPELLEILKVFNEISQVDPEADCDEESFTEVCSYISSALLSEFQAHAQA